MARTDLDAGRLAGLALTVGRAGWSAGEPMLARLETGLRRHATSESRAIALARALLAPIPGPQVEAAAAGYRFPRPRRHAVCRRPDRGPLASSGAVGSASATGCDALRPSRQWSRAPRKMVRLGQRRRCGYRDFRGDRRTSGLTAASVSGRFLARPPPAVAGALVELALARSAEFFVRTGRGVRARRGGAAQSPAGIEHPPR